MCHETSTEEPACLGLAENQAEIATKKAQAEDVETRMNLESAHAVADPCTEGLCPDCGAGGHTTRAGHSMQHGQITHSQDLERERSCPTETGMVSAVTHSACEPLGSLQSTDSEASRQSPRLSSLNLVPPEKICPSEACAVTHLNLDSEPAASKTVEKLACNACLDPPDSGKTLVAREAGRDISTQHPAALQNNTNLCKKMQDDIQEMAQALMVRTLCCEGLLTCQAALLRESVQLMQFHFF